METKEFTDFDLFASEVKKLHKEYKEYRRSWLSAGLHTRKEGYFLTESVSIIFGVGDKGLKLWYDHEELVSEKIAKESTLNDHSQRRNHLERMLDSVLKEP